MTFEIFGFGHSQTHTNQVETSLWNGRSISRLFSGAFKVVAIGLLFYSCLNAAETNHTLAVNNENIFTNPVQWAISPQCQKRNDDAACYEEYAETKIGVEKAYWLKRTASSVDTRRSYAEAQDLKRSAELWKRAGDALKKSIDDKNSLLGVYSLGEFRLNCYAESYKMYERLIVLNSSQGGDVHISSLDLASLHASTARVYFTDSNNTIPMGCATNRFREAGSQAASAALWFKSASNEDSNADHEKLSKLWRNKARKAFLESARCEEEIGEKRARDYYQASRLTTSKIKAQSYLTLAKNLLNSGGDTYEMIYEALSTLSSSEGTDNPLMVDL